MKTRTLSIMLGVAILSLSGLTMYAQGYFSPFGSSFGFSMPSQEQQQMYQQYQDQMRTRIEENTDTSQQQQQQAPQQQTSDQQATGTVSPDQPCPQTLDPVCGTDGITYANECQAKAQGATVAYTGKCSPNAQDKQPAQDKNAENDAEDADMFENQAANMVETGKKAKKSSKKSSPKSTQSFSIGPGPDREVFSLYVSGNGELTATLTWTGSAEGLQIEIAPREMPEKKENNQVGVKRRGARVTAAALNQFQTNQDVSDDIFESTENLGDELGASLYAIQEQGPSPLSTTLEIGDTMPSDLLVTITSFEGEAQGTLSLSGDVAVSNVVKQEADVAGLDAAGKIIVPLVMYQLDRYFKNPAQKNSLDTKFATHLSQLPLAQDKLKIALNRYKTFSLAKKKSLFNGSVVTKLAAEKGQALSQKKITEIKNILQPLVPPSTPKDMSGSVTLTDPDAQTGGKLLKLQWKHSGLFTDKYVIERAPAQIIEQILNLNELQFEQYAETKKPRGKGLRKFQKILSYEAYPNLYCYRVRAVNKNGSSDYTNNVCPELTGISTVSTKFNVKWAYLRSIEEADVDGLSDSDEPYLIFTIINGKNSDGTPHTWVRKWDAADDVDSGETEPDDERASFTLFGEPPTEAMNDLLGLKDQLADTPQYEYQDGYYTVNPDYAAILDEIRNHEWGSKHIRNDEMPADIDLHTGLIIATTIMEEDAGAHITLEEQIKAGIQAAQDIAEAFMDPSGISIAYAIKSTAEFMYKMWANDDYVGTDSWRLTFTNANELVYPPHSTGAYLKEMDINGGGDGHYTVGFCLYKENTNSFTIQQGCGIAPAQ